MINGKVKELATIIRNMRKKSGLSVRYVAEKCNVPFGYLAAFERGEIERPKIQMLQALASMFGLDSDDLIRTCGKITPDVYWKVVRCPQLLKVIRDYPE